MLYFITKILSAFIRKELFLKIKRKEAAQKFSEFENSLVNTLITRLEGAYVYAVLLMAEREKRI